MKIFEIESPNEEPTLRDWFAGLAMEGIVYEGVTPEQTAKAAYQMADAMMKEKENK